MKRRFLGFGIISLALGSSIFCTATMQRAYALDTVSDEQMALIRSRCTDLQASLNRINERDTSLRVNLGSSLIALPEKMMTPLNKRIAANTLDGSKLLGITVDYTMAYEGQKGDDFYSLYKTYSTSLNTVMQIDCTKEPTTFLDALAIARTNRQKVHESAEKLIALATAYQTEFRSFSVSVKKGNDGR